ncbi:MAG: hypothetical protein ACO1OB_19425 [Archangium sp.]
MLSLLVGVLLTAQPSVAVLSSSGSTGELRFQPVDSSELAAPVVRFTHAEGSPVLGSLLPGSQVVVATAVMKDTSFGSVLLRLEEKKQARVLADGVVYGSRPLVTSEGRVFVARGRAGTEISPQGRIDSLVVDEVNPVTAKTRTVHSSNGFLTFLAGALGRELFIYELTTSGARLIAVHVDTLAVRVLIADMVPLARDFVVDAPNKRLLFTQGTPFEDAWFVEQFELTTLKRNIVARSNEPTLLPAVVNGKLVFNVGAHERFGRLGYTRVQHGVSLHEVPGDFPVAYLNERRLKTAPDARLDIAGVTP